MKFFTRFWRSIHARQPPPCADFFRKWRSGLKWVGLQNDEDKDHVLSMRRAHGSLNFCGVQGSAVARQCFRTQDLIHLQTPSLSRASQGQAKSTCSKCTSISRSIHSIRRSHGLALFGRCRIHQRLLAPLEHVDGPGNDAHRISVFLCIAEERQPCLHFCERGLRGTAQAV